MFMDKIFTIAFIVAGLIWIWGCFVQGRKNALQREKNCTETITAQVLGFKEYHFFFLKYYSLSLKYTYNDKEYNVKKGWFAKWGDKKEIPLHINPNNPVECYLTTLKQKCKRSY